MKTYRLAIVKDEYKNDQTITKILYSVHAKLSDEQLQQISKFNPSLQDASISMKLAEEAAAKIMADIKTNSPAKK